MKPDANMELKAVLTAVAERVLVAKPNRPVPQWVTRQAANTAPKVALMAAAEPVLVAKPNPLVHQQLTQLAVNTEQKAVLTVVAEPVLAAKELAKAIAVRNGQVVQKALAVLPAFANPDLDQNRKAEDVSAV